MIALNSLNSSNSQQQSRQQIVYLDKEAKGKIFFNPKEGHIVLQAKTALQLFYAGEKDEPIPFEQDVPIPAPLRYEGSILIEGSGPGVHTATLAHILPDGSAGETLTIQSYYLPIKMSLDSNRDGKIDRLDIGKANWVYGDGEQGAVLLINNDKDASDQLPVAGEYSEWSELRIAPIGVEALPTDFELALEVTPQVAECCAIYYKDERDEFHHLLGKNLLKPDEPTIAVSEALPATGVHCFMEAHHHQHPGEMFDGLITLNLLLRHKGEIVARDRAVCRIAPWIMTPNTLTPAEVYACEVDDNEQFLSDLKSALDELDIPLTVISKQDNRGDRWIQDEIEFGYMQGAAHTVPVVFDSPRDRELDDYPEVSLLGPDFGHFQVGNNSLNSLDSFGNLEVSPPVSVNGRHYPFGRIVFGGRRKGDYHEDARQMMPELRHFLYAQKIQAPFELYTDWLDVGHVDEIISFVPADNDKQFQVLTASPLNANIILKRLADRGFADAVMFEGMKRGTPDSSESAEITIGELLADIDFWNANQQYQSYMNHNIQILRQELGINGHHIVNIPVLFHPPFPDGRTVAYFPNMINHLVLGEASLVPKPKGPIINGKCAFETAFEHALPGRKVRFIENWYSYHEMAGEVHCGTNTRRHPFPDERWWNYKPDGGFDI